MFAAYAELDAGTRRPAPLRCNLDELADSGGIEADEGIARENALVDIVGSGSGPRRRG